MNDNRNELAHTIVIMHNEGFSIRALCRRFHMGKSRVRKILRDHEARRDSGHELLTKRIKRASKLDAYESVIKTTLEKYPGLTGLRMFEKLKEEAGYTGGISILREFLKKHGAAQQEPVLRFETEPGRQGQMDWSPYKIKFIRAGNVTVQCFSYVLGFSRRQYIDFTLRHDFHTLIRRHQDAFLYFNGVPLECLYDNEKTVVLRWEAGRPVYNPAFAAFITHYNCKPIACRPRTPQTKGKVEAPFKYVEKNFLGGRDFQDLEDLRAMARWWLKEKSDLHLHDTTGRAPIELFAEEKLQPLPLHPYDTAEVALAVCGADACVTFETNHYSVLSGNIADILTVKATEREVMIYNPELELLATHERQPAGSGRRVENPEHRSTRKDRYGLEPVREAFLALGEAAESFLKGLMEKQPRNCGFHARHILRLKEHYETGDIDKALLHAIGYLAFEAQAVERILRAKATPRTLESTRNERAGRELEKTLPKITQRPLDEYRKLFDQETTEHEESDPAGSDSDKNQKPSCDPETHGDPENP